MINTFRRKAPFLVVLSVVVGIAVVAIPAVLAATRSYSFTGITPATHIIALQAGDYVEATLECAGGSNMNPFLGAATPDGVDIATNSDADMNNGPGCYGIPGNSVLNSFIAFTAPVSGNYTFGAYDQTGLSNDAYQLSVTVVSAGSAVESLSEVPFVPGDARINHRVKDRGAAVAIYCNADGDLSVWSIDPQGKGHDTLTVTAGVIEAVGIPSEAEHHYELAAANVPFGRIALYRLWTGEFQVNAPGLNPDSDMYTFIWTECVGK